MNPNSVKELYQKYLDGSCTPEEKELLEKAFLVYAQAQDTLPDESTIQSTSERVRDHLSTLLRHDLRRRQRRHRIYYLAAALLTVFISIGLITWNMSHPESDTQHAWTADAQPGSNKATLTLSNGHTVHLKEVTSGIVAGENITYADGSPVVNETDLSQSGKPTPRKAATQMLTLTTPRGGTYKVTLPDGSGVWLNANSVLRYPARFANTQRVVDIEGEAYFEVVTDEKRPFKVRTAGQEVVVLGTSFNLSAYPEDHSTATTLVEGSIRIVNKSNQTVHMLRPGQQAKLSSTGVQVYPVDTEAFIAWKNGYFYFDDADMYTILKDFSRWYNVEIEVSLLPESELFTGKIPRNVSLQNALRIVEKTSGMSFQLIDNKLKLSRLRKGGDAMDH